MPPFCENAVGYAPTALRLVFFVYGLFLGVALNQDVFDAQVVHFLDGKGEIFKLHSGLFTLFGDVAQLVQHKARYGIVVTLG